MVKFTVTNFEEGISLIKFCKKKLSKAPGSIFFKLFRKKDIKVNGKREKEDYKVKDGDLVEIYITTKQEEDFLNTKHSENYDSNFYKDLNIIYEDPNIIIVNKPKGLLTVSDINEKKIILVNKVNAYLKNKNISNEAVPIHRLDKNTRGLVIFGKNQKCINYLNELIKNKSEISKHYYALVKGKTPKEEIIDKPLFKDEKNNTVYIDEKKGKKSLTIFKTIASNNNYSLLDVNLITGRTHQIRVHLASINHPIIGDKKYGDKASNEFFHKNFDFDYQFLIAYKIKFLNLNDDFSYLNNKEFKIDFDKKEKQILKNLKLTIF